MSSREDFMRAMGICADDLRQPPPEQPQTRRRVSEPQTAPVQVASPPAVATSPGKQQSRADFLRSLGIENADRAPVSQQSATANARASDASPKQQTAAGQSRAEFLRSLGIDNAGSDAPMHTTARNATGSQEYSAVPVAEYPAQRSAKAKAVVMASTEDDAPQPRAPFQPKSDLMLGPGLGAPRERAAAVDGASAEQVKAEGNKHFQSGDYRKAVRLYTKAIDMDSTNAALYSNRSAAYLLGGKQMGIDTRNMALRDAEKVIKLKPTWFKGFSRRGDALFKLERYDDAAEAYESALELDPGNTSIQHSLNEVRPFTRVKRDAAVEGSAWNMSTNLNSSVASSVNCTSTSKSAYEMLDEFQRERDRTTPYLGRGGNDYKSEQLARYRQTSNSQEHGCVSEEHVPQSPAPTPANQRSVPAEFSSDAARDYQQALLDTYRRTKAMRTNAH